MSVTTSIQYVEGDATRPIGEGTRIIVHCCNDIGAWGKGFVLALSRRWPLAESEYKAWHESQQNELKKLPLGAVQFVFVGGDSKGAVYVCNLIGQEGIYRIGGEPPIRYRAIEEGFKIVSRRASRLGERPSIHMPRIGCGLAGGTWDRIEPLIEERLAGKGLPVFVYDLPPKGRSKGQVKGRGGR